MNREEALKHFEAKFPQFRVYARKDDVVVRDEDSNLIAIYKFSK